MSVGFKRHDHTAGGSGYTSKATIDRVVAAIKKRTKIVRGVDVPYCAGYSEDGSTVYIDREVPKTFNLRGKPCDVDKYLVLHEMIEWALMEHLGIPYQYAHALATVCEEKAVQADGHDLSAYNSAWDTVIRKVGSRGKYPNIPKDLDTEPYEDEGQESEVEEPGDSLMGGKAMGYYS